MFRNINPFTAVTALCPLMLLGLCAAVYWPGLSGDFLFDDYVNLNALGRYGGVRDLDSLLFYLTSGIADPTGRPVAMASFLLDARNWPADPFPFKRTNLLLHLLNGALLYSLLAALGRRASPDTRRARIAALLAAALWLLSPLWVSTVLYVVQRHAMLAAFFCLCGVRTWVAGHTAFEAGNHRRGWAFALCAMGVFGLLAGLSKANGFLLPVLLAVLELTLLRPAGPVSPARRWARTLLVWLPACAVLGWLLWSAFQTGLDGTNGRDWTLGQRLLSEPRALCSYLWQLFVPGLDATGVFADGFAPSQTWRAPWTTLPALLCIAALAAAAWALRRRMPLLAAAIGFFLAGHAMESSVVMLELYFEHRNYLPAMLIFWPLAWWLAAPRGFRRWLLLGGFGYAALMLLATAAQARLWGDPLALALTWAEQNPDSARAQTYAFQQERAAGRAEAAERRLSVLLERHPEEPQFALNLLDLRCEQQRVRQADLNRAAVAIRASGGLAKDINNQWLGNTLRPGSTSACAWLPPEALQGLADAAKPDLQEPAREAAEVSARNHYLAGIIAMGQGHCDAAVLAFDHRIEVQPRPEFVQAQAVLLATRCKPADALAHLNHYLDAGAPVSRASSPMLRLRDRLMQDWWGAYWGELGNALQSEIDSAERPDN